MLSEALETYLLQSSADEPALLAELRRETFQKVLQPRMLSGPHQGRLLSVLSQLMQPKAILEIGTYTGYATLCLAEGLQADGHIDTIDVNEELTYIQQKYFQKSSHPHQIRTHLGPAADLIPHLETTYDIVFIDADKDNYPLYADLVIPKVRKGGLVISDNVLWSGKVLEPVKPNDRATLALLAFNQKMQADPRLDTVMLPLRDGLTLSRVK